MLNMVDLILKKEKGEELTEEELSFIVNGFVAGSVPEYQMAAFLMAVYFKGMTVPETSRLTKVMLYSGDTADLSELPGIKSDKHSTGGVADTTTLILVPLVAACGGTVAKMSGRGLGHTGGTLDKLESIPGVCVEQPIQKFFASVKRNGAAVIGQTGNFVPADKKIYALRDVTGTVGSIPLIASSIMSKKLASGSDVIVLDIKVGSGAFMKTAEEARELGKLMVGIGSHCGRKCTAVLTDMDQPLGSAIGNAWEVREAVEALSGLVPMEAPLMQVSLTLGAAMLCLSGLCKTMEDGKAKLREAISDGKGIAVLKHMIADLGGDDSYIDPEKIKELTKTKLEISVSAESNGYVASMDTEMIGNASRILGAGRAKLTDVIDPSVGILFRKRLGEPIVQGEEICTVFANDEKKAAEAVKMIREAVRISEEHVKAPELIIDVISE